MDQWFHTFSAYYCPHLSREEMEHSQCLSETCPGSPQLEDGGALPDHQDPVWWNPCSGSGIHTEGTEEKGKIDRFTIYNSSFNRWGNYVCRFSVIRVMLVMEDSVKEKKCDYTGFEMHHESLAKLCHNNMWVIRYWTDRPIVGNSSASLNPKETTISSSNCISKIQPNIFRNFITTIELAFWGLYHPRKNSHLAHTHLHIDGAKWLNYLP